MSARDGRRKQLLSVTMHRWTGWLCWIVTTIMAVSGVVRSEEPKGTTSPPPTTTSRYMVASGEATPDDQGYRSGCADGRAGLSGLRVLFFGTQESNGRIRPPGTTASSPATRVSEDWVARSTAGWIKGFVECGQATAILALGVNNKADGGADPAEAGAAWARLMERVAEAAPDDRVVVAGAFDGEPSWSEPAWARRWVDSYVRSSGRALYAVNSADGCPQDDSSDTCAKGWRVADLFHISTGAAPTVIALPQIYRTDGTQARQWAAISRWGVRTGAGPLRVAGVLTQQAACRQRSGCTRTNNSPDQARDQLTEALGADPATAPSQPLVTTDVRWPEDLATP